MKPHPFAWILLFAAATATLRADQGLVLGPGAEGEWAPLISKLAASGAIEASFTERRYFPFRHEPTILSGTLRISPEKGLSLQYAGTEPSILIADSGGLLLRDASGRSREMPAGSRQGGAVASLLPIMRFDLAELFPRFEVRAQMNGGYWRFDFTPRDSETMRTLGTITVVGTGAEVRHLEFKRSESQRVEIDVEGTRHVEAFTPVELRRYFR